jgi:small conductance mechanosensitive channel
MKLRSKTICGIVNSCIIVFVSIIAIMLILGELGINIAPILAGAGVLGLAVSFGAQNLVKDVITGFFILFEDQYGIGDVIQIDSHTGIVESMNLRTTILRDMSGNVHIIPNGEIKQVVVMTKLWSRAVVDIQVFYKQDINKILDLITQEANALYAEWNDKITEQPEILGINSIDPNGVTIRVLLKTKPAEQWSVEREIRRRVIERFNQLGIYLPYFQSSCLENLK